MWLAPGIDRPRNSAHADARPGSLVASVSVDVQMARPGVVEVLRQRALQHAEDALNVGVGEIAPAPAGLEQEERLRVQRGGVEVVRIGVDDLLHRVGIGAVLIDAPRRIEARDVPDRHRLMSACSIGVAWAGASAIAFWIAAYANGASSALIVQFRSEPHAHASPQ